MYASNSHCYTHLILALGIVRKPTVWVIITLNILAHMTLACLVVGPYRDRGYIAGIVCALSNHDHQVAVISVIPALRPVSSGPRMYVSFV